LYKLVISLIVSALCVFFLLHNEKSSFEDEIKTIANSANVISAKYVDSVSGKGLIMIGQVHLNPVSDKNSLDHIRKVAENHKYIAVVVSKLKERYGKRVKFCVEGNFNVDAMLNDLDEEIETLNLLYDKIQFEYKKGDIKSAVDNYMGWRSAVEMYVYPGALKQMTLISGQLQLARLAEDLKTDKFNSLLINVENLSNDLLYANGALQYLYKNGTLQKDDFVICENETAVNELVELLYSEDDKKIVIADRIKLVKFANERREIKYIKNVQKTLENDDEVDFVVGVYGAMHDLSQQIIKLQIEGEVNFGYLFILTKPLTDEYLATFHQ